MTSRDYGYGGTYEAQGDELKYGVRRCPRCEAWKPQETSAGWWCATCDLVSRGGTEDEWEAMEAQREQWAAGTHPAQVPPAPMPVATPLQPERAPCQVCGVAHARPPDPARHRPAVLHVRRRPARGGRR